MTNPPAPLRFERADPPEVAALKALKSAQPDLGAAVDMQIELVGLYRRMQGRISTPWIDLKPDVVSSRLRSGTPILSAHDVAFDWAELRSMVRHIADLLKRFELLEPADYASGGKRAGFARIEWTTIPDAATAAAALRAGEVDW